MSKSKDLIPLPDSLRDASPAERERVIRWAASQLAQWRRDPSGGITRWGGRPPASHDWTDPTCGCSFCVRKQARENANAHPEIRKSKKTS